MGTTDKYWSPKYMALFLLIVQNTFLVLAMRKSRTTKGAMYASSTAVAIMEILKFITCLIKVALDNNGINGLRRSLQLEVYTQPMEIIKLAIPSILYCMQNNLLYYALSHLDAATFQVGYQVKILTTAVFSVTMLGKSLSKLQWFSLLLLTVGVAMAQLSAHASSSSAHNTISGFIAVLLASITSGFSGVYFERILKNSTTSLWMRNIQMGISSIFVAFLGVFFSSDRHIVFQNGFFYGYNSIVVCVILLQALGGLVVAAVVKYADNIMKGFAAAVSIVTSCLLCYCFFDFRPSSLFIYGTLLVTVSVYLYSYGPPQKIKADIVKDEIIETSPDKV